ncbi:hypothetical protein, partial [Staphylococcus felis]|uniref:hypothetical protein n=1 Tax=Staphylococcus felis TaxID=46127 RepID=UPI000E37BD84
KREKKKRKKEKKKEIEDLKEKKENEIGVGIVGSEMSIRERIELNPKLMHHLDLKDCDFV